MRVRTFGAVAALAGAVAFFTYATPSGAQLVSRFEVAGAVFSPDGDGRQDTTQVNYALTDTVLEVSVIVFEADSITPVDTLRAPAPDLPPDLRKLTWKGRRWDGTPAAEGAYVVALHAVGDDGPEVRKYLPAFIDVTPPSIAILSVVPDPYAPGLATGPASVSISFVVGNASPVFLGRPPDELRSAFVNPGNSAVTPSSLTTSPPFAGAGGSYVMAWNASSEVSSLTDGEYRVTLTVVDAAGYSAASSYHFDIDTRAPEVTVTDPPSGSSVRTAPDSLYGYAVDARGVDSLFVRYGETRPYHPVASTYVLDDTLHFSVPLADSVLGEGRHDIDLRAVDGVGRATVHLFSITIDVTAPSPPVLDAFDGVWHGDVYPLSGTVGAAEIGSFVRIFRNGVPVDSVSTSIRAEFTASARLVPGTNRLRAVFRDAAFNASGPSNTVTVRFESGEGLFLPTPFAPGASFQLNAPRTAQGAALRVFDVTGDLVVGFESRDARQFYAFPWDGANADGVRVRKGPLVAVGSIDYEDGSRGVVRRVFLFDPEGRP